jgi:hypothetical protein
VGSADTVAWSETGGAAVGTGRAVDVPARRVRLSVLASDRVDPNLRLGEETMGRQVEYHWMGRVRVDKKIFEAPRW